ncbi:MAG: hypothetical protein GEU86_22520 [Actinophytocola sp.]|nr:hypothetical protein [Actinophytocola sp.]
MKRYIQVRPLRGAGGRLLALILVALVVYGLIVQPAEMAQIARAIGTALAGIADAVLSFLREM